MSGVFYFLVVLICANEVKGASVAVSQRPLRFLLFFGIGIIHGLVPLLGAEYSIGPWEPSDDAIDTAPLVTFAGVIAMAIAWRISDHLGKRATPQPLREVVNLPGFQRGARRLTAICMVIGVVAALGVFISSAGSVGAYTEGSRFEFRASGGLLGLVFLQLLAVAPVPGFMMMLLNRRRWRIACLVYVLAFSGWYYFATRGTRSIPLGVLGALLMGYILTRKPRRSASLVPVIAVLVGTFMAIGLYAVRRDLGRLSVTEAAATLSTLDTYRDALNTDPLNYHGQFLAAIDHFPDEHGYLSGDSYRRIVMLPVPASVAPSLKPPDTHITVGEAVYGNETAISLPPSIPGDGWVNLHGAPGVVLIMIVWGFIGAWIDRIITRRAWWALWLGPSLVRLIILFLRGQPYEVFVIGFATFALFWVIVKVLGMKPLAAGPARRGALPKVVWAPSVAPRR